jgi:hypothetical protein
VGSLLDLSEAEVPCEEEGSENIAVESPYDDGPSRREFRVTQLD